MTFIWFSCIIKIPKGDPPTEVFPINKILPPVDGSRPPLRTLKMAQRLCAPAESDITIVKVVSAQLYINSLDEIKRNAEKAQPELDAVAALLPGYQVKTQVLLGLSLISI